ncbi:tRNA (adenosine(37)-N6)-dimethylallyltransferase MiaA [Candidatus Sulfurimonas baltica]|uniref:tRNA dimethylallyltransferase n=1 Tax=Candidatus Sulfurimonas baltica TaxID=2740404 RepID=A0A7S7LVN7_9BACT|nr:tRNA (adenosine(37)-N6)-dimethylallyltransferase MiaA [Candidatus Sulfurimonas baltica]QOY52359.1 tRNA (adenosine(37)-N6)-dimethylallyltransferase MiaA [Candidatus Sulfurimonas baltica]
MKQLAIIGPTASGKSDLAINIAKKINAHILSIDSLSIYKEIDIVSAKPSSAELNSVKHFGINLLNPDEYFSVDIFIDLYKKILSTCRGENKNLIIVGGTSFYLKSLLEGLSKLPDISNETKLHVELKLKNLKECYGFLYDLDAPYMSDISPNDSYRIEKAMLIYEASTLTPSEWFRQNSPKPTIENLNIYNIDVDRAVLRERISKRTSKMLELGLIDEVCALEKKYTRAPHAMNSIGIVEVLEYLDGKVTKEVMLDNISTHTAQLAKRQQTFNRTQFKGIVSAPLEELEEIILSQIS